MLSFKEERMKEPIGLLKAERHFSEKWDELEGDHEKVKNWLESYIEKTGGFTSLAEDWLQKKLLSM